MNADERPDLHAAHADARPCKAETHTIMGSAFEVLNELGHGFHEKLYENALMVEPQTRPPAVGKIGADQDKAKRMKPDMIRRDRTMTARRGPKQTAGRGMEVEQHARYLRLSASIRG